MYLKIINENEKYGLNGAHGQYSYGVSAENNCGGYGVAAVNISA